MPILTIAVDHTSYDKTVEDGVGVYHVDAPGTDERVVCRILRILAEQSVGAPGYEQWDMACAHMEVDGQEFSITVTRLTATREGPVRGPLV